jgi:hypothetical protein
MVVRLIVEPNLVHQMDISREKVIKLSIDVLIFFEKNEVFFKDEVMELFVLKYMIFYIKYSTLSPF